MELLTVPRDHLHDAACRIRRRACDVDHAFEEEAQPGFPRSLRANSLEMVVVSIAITLQIEAQVEQGPREYPLGDEQERDQEAANPAVAIEKRMDRLELSMSQSRPH